MFDEGPCARMSTQARKCRVPIDSPKEIDIEGFTEAMRFFGKLLRRKGAGSARDGPRPARLARTGMR